MLDDSTRHVPCFASTITTRGKTSYEEKHAEKLQRSHLQDGVEALPSNIPAQAAQLELDW
jgi:hypothetical protein